MGILSEGGGLPGDGSAISLPSPPPECISFGSSANPPLRLASLPVQCHDQGMGEISDRLDDSSGMEPEFHERVRGVVEQVKADYATGTESDARAMLEQRLQQTGVSLAPAEVDALVRQIEDTRR